MNLILRCINCVNNISRSRSNSCSSGTENRMSNDASENRNHNANKSKALNYLEYTIILKFMNNTNSVANISNVKRGGRDKDENRDETLTTNYNDKNTKNKIPLSASLLILNRIEPISPAEKGITNAHTCNKSLQLEANDLSVPKLESVLTNRRNTLRLKALRLTRIYKHNDDGSEEFNDKLCVTNMENKKNQSLNSSSSEEEALSLKMNKSNKDCQNIPKKNNSQMAHLSSFKNSSYTNNNRFIRRLFACGGYCARSNRRTSSNVANSNSAYGLSKSTTMIPGSSTTRSKEPILINQSAEKNVDSDAKNLLDTNYNTNNTSNNQQLHSQLSLSNNNTNQQTLIAGDMSPSASQTSIRKQSYESIIEKILSTPTKLRANNISAANLKVNLLSKVARKDGHASAAISNSSVNGAASASNNGVNKALPKQPIRKNLLNENLKKIEHDNHKLFKKTETYIDKNTNIDESNSIILPVLKINDCHLSNNQQKNSSIQVINSTNNKYTSRSRSINNNQEPNSADSISSNMNVRINNAEDSEEYEDEDDEESDDVDDEEMEANIVAMQREVLKVLRNQSNAEYDIYMDDLEETNEENYNLYYSENYDEDYDEIEMRQKNLDNRLSFNQKITDINNNSKDRFSNSSEKQKQANGLKVSDSLNPTSRRMSADTEDDDLMINSNKYFNSLQHFQFGKTSDEFKKANDLCTTSYGEDLNSANNGANLFVLLATKRNTNAIESRSNLDLMKTPVKNNSTSNFLSPTCIVPSASLNNNLTSNIHKDHQDSFIRQSSHDLLTKSKQRQQITANVSVAPISSMSVSTTNTSDSNITTPYSLNLPQNQLESMSQISSIYSIDKSSSTLPKVDYGRVKSTDSNSKETLIKKISTSTNSSEEADVLNEIFKVNQWLKDNHHKHSKLGIIEHLENIKTDQRNQGLIDSILNQEVLSEVNNEDDDEYDDDDQEINIDGNTGDQVGNKGSSGENNDSAIDISSYGSISNICKISSKNSRVKWQSFTKYYRTNMQQNTAWSQYQISNISCEQLMALRKLALLQFSKLLERQHSSMIRTLRLFSKKKDLAEFQRVYDSIDSLSKSDSSKIKSDIDNINESVTINTPENVIIDTKKISHQLGAQIGAHPTNEITSSRKRHKNKMKKLEQQLINEKMSILPKSNSKIFQDSESYLQESSQKFANHLTAVSDYRNDNLKRAPIFHKHSRTVFGVPLSKIIQQSGQALPQRILEAMKFIRKIAQQEVGIFRKNGVKTRITKLKELIDKNESINFQSSDYTVFDIADMIKLYFRELPECLLTNKLSDILLTHYKKILPEERKIILQQVMLLIPDENRLVLQTLLLFLNEIAKYNKINQMTRSNLAVCFSPVIFRFSLEKKTHLKNKLESTSSYSKPLPATTNLSVTSSTNVFNENNVALSKNLQQKPPQLQQQNNYPDIAIALPIQNSSSFIKGACSTPSNNQISSPVESLKITEMGYSILTAESDLTVKTFCYDNTELKKETITEEHSVSQKNTFINELATNSANVPLIHKQTLQDQIVSVNSKDKQNYKRKYSEKINKAASSLVNFGAELSSSKPTAFFSDSFKENLENMSKVIQLCVSDMIKYSMDLFTVLPENFEKTIYQSRETPETPKLDYFYNSKKKELLNTEFFTTKFNSDNIFWIYQDKFEDVSIYFSKNDQPSSSQPKPQQPQQLQTNKNSNTANPISSNKLQSYTPVPFNIPSQVSIPVAAGCVSLTSVLVPKPECFYNKLKLWKCCTLVKTPNLTIEKIVNRIKNERHIWDDDFKMGKVFKILDENTDLCRSVINFMPPHQPREFFEIRHLSMEKSDKNIAILTSSSILPESFNDDFDKKSNLLEVTGNLIVSKYVIEKLIANDTMTTFKITHYTKLDYKGFTLEFYNKTFGYIMARLLYSLKLSLTDENKS